MADTFFIGQLGEPRQVAAATLNMPLFMFMTALSNLFGVGGSSLISRFLGANEHKKSISLLRILYLDNQLYLPFYMVFLCSCSVLSLCQFLAQMKKLFPLPLPTCLDNRYRCCTHRFKSGTCHLIRAEGYSKQASFGVAFGGVLNILLDPLSFTVFGFRSLVLPLQH